MTSMKRTLSILAAVLCLGTMAAPAQEAEADFRKGEWQISRFAPYTDQNGDKWGLGTAVTYYLTKHFGFGGANYWTDFSGSFFDNLEGEGYFRITDVKRLNPYAVGSLGYQFDGQYLFGTFGAGVNFQALKKLTVFSDLQYRLAHDSNDGVFLRLGVRFSF